MHTYLEGKKSYLGLHNSLSEGFDTQTLELC